MCVFVNGRVEGYEREGNREEGKEMGREGDIWQSSQVPVYHLALASYNRWEEELEGG